LEPDFNISLDGFNTEEEANQIGWLVLDATKSLAVRFNLDISKLKKAVISYNFAAALEKVTSEYNHELPSTFTDSKQGVAVAQLVSKVGSNGMSDEYTLVMSVEFFVEMFDENGKLDFNEKAFGPIIHRLHHELIHVDERNKLIGLDPAYRVNEYGEALLITATRAWSEYLANYMSSQTAPKEIIDDFLNNLKTVVDEVSEEIEMFVLKYKIHVITLDAMFFEVKKRVKLIINSYGYAIGYVHALKINLEEDYPDLVAAISNSKIKHPLSSLSESFDGLMSKYSGNNIESYEDFLDLTESVDALFKAFGLTLDCADWSGESRLYIHVN